MSGEHMSKEIIYEKKYPRIDPMVELKNSTQERVDDPKEPIPTFEEIMKKIQTNTTYVLMPERIKGSEEFIQTAIEISKLYELDTRIERRFDHISVIYSFDCCGGLRYINQVFKMADQFSFFTDIHDRDITISFDYFTHASVRNGRIVSP